MFPFQFSEVPQESKDKNKHMDLIIGGSIGGGLFILACLAVIGYAMIKCMHTPRVKKQLPYHGYPPKMQYPSSVHSHSTSDYYVKGGPYVHSGRRPSVTRPYFGK